MEKNPTSASRSSSIIDSLESLSSEGVSKDCHRNTIVQLNVGGEIVSTYLGTLIEMEGTYFSNWLSGRFRIDHDQPLFIDRDPIYFRHVLNFLRKGCIRIPQGHQYIHLYENLLDEANYFGIEPMQKYLLSLLDKFRTPSSFDRLKTNREAAYIDTDETSQASSFFSVPVTNTRLRGRRGLRRLASPPTPAEEHQPNITASEEPLPQRLRFDDYDF